MLSYVMGHADLSIWPQMALVMFLAVFTGVAIRVFQKSRRNEYARAALLPLEDERDSHV